MVDKYKPDGPDGPDWRDFGEVVGMDPAADWLLRVGVDDFLPDGLETPIPLLIELDEEAVGPFQTLLETRRGATVLGFGPANDRVKAGALLPVIATRAFLLQLLDGSDDSRRFNDASKRIELSTPGTPPVARERPLGDGEAAGGRLDGLECIPACEATEGVVVAAIDDGFAFAHERFRAADGTSRIEAFWDMNADFPLPSPPLGEQTKATIDTLIANAQVDGHIEEDLVYRNAPVLDFADPRHKPLAWRASHGTHVLDLAAGSEPGEGGHPIIAVGLPSPVVALTTGELLDFYVWLGVLYILHRAGQRRVVINISFGYDAGPHDGEGLLEKHLGLLSEVRPDRPVRCVVLPAGNGQLARGHATVDLAANAEVAFDWIVQPDDRTHSIVEIWMPQDPATPDHRMRVTVIQPDGTARFLDETPGAAPVLLPFAGRDMGLLQLWTRQDGRRLFRIAIFPTARPQPDARPLAPAGPWRLVFTRGTQPMAEPAHAWVQRDDSLYGYPQRGRQSYFDHADYVRFRETPGPLGEPLGEPLDEDPPGSSGPITRSHLLNAIATSPNVVVAGGYRTRDLRIARYSTGGPIFPPEAPGRRKPDVLLPSDCSVALSGMLAAGARSGARLASDGTSAAAPQLVRHIAGWLATSPDPGRPAVAAAVLISPVPATSTPADRGGHGRLPRLDPPPSERVR